MLTVLDLFSGIGGFSLGLERTGHFKTVAFCEIDGECRKQLTKNFNGVYAHDDIKTLNGGDYATDVICGGFPCQPYSRGGKHDPNDDRLLWPEMLRVIGEAKAAGGGRWIVGENVNGLDDMGALDGVLSDLEALGYEAWAVNIPAGACPGADHLRERWWIIANDNSKRAERRIKKEICRWRTLQRDKNGGRFQELRGGPSIFKPGSRIGANGIPATLVRLTKRQKWQLKCLGNAVHPYIPEQIGYAIAEADPMTKEAM